jgi:hypothetical protein
VAERDDRFGRDSRLLALVILIALAVLVVLARFRFPPTSDSRPAAVAPGPLERLSARATYDDLAAAVHSALQRVEPALLTVILEADPAAGKPGPGGELIPGAGPERRRLVAVRLRRDTAIAFAPKGFRVASGELDEPMTVRGIDLAKEVTVITPSLQTPNDQQASPADEFAGFAYVCVIEPTAAGPTATPVFLGRVRVESDARWAGDVLMLGGTPGLPVGSMVFQLDGRFIGMITSRPDGAQTLVPAPLLELALVGLSARPPGGDR